jgi:hypothetical protein
MKIKYIMYNVQDYNVVYIITLFARLYVRGVGILLTRENHMHDSIISLTGKVWVLNTSLAPPLFIEVPVPG